VSDAAVDVPISVLPEAWSANWGEPTRFLAAQLATLREGMEELASDIAFIDRTATFNGLVGSNQLREHPIHRWYYYKEGFSPLLPRIILQERGAGKSGNVVDPFAGVGTTALSLRGREGVNSVIGIEYSPFACFVGQTKLAATSLNRDALLSQIARIADLKPPFREPTTPALAAFHNPEIFAPEKLKYLLAMRDCIREDDQLNETEKSFMLLGLAAVVEDLSSAMKDGRALRILRGRKRRRQGLRPTTGCMEGDDPRAVITNQWLAMVQDLETSTHPKNGVTAIQVRGDARTLGESKDGTGDPIIKEGNVGLYVYSPPYLNFVDYTEVYKLELWMLEMVSDQAGFRALREGTLRSHPSITFPDRRQPPTSDALIFTIIEEITKFLTEHLARRSIAPVHKYYFLDMYEALREQYRTLEPGGSIACVVANSTLSRRSWEDGTRRELWRIPIMTDVFLARLAEVVGFKDIQIWKARDLQAKNVNGGYARESIVVARKPPS
jgi:SAM-dependent methyltransferase